MTNEEKYIKAFNVGYQLGKHDPQLLEQLSKSNEHESEYLQALKMGAKQFDREKLLDQVKKSHQKNNEKGLSR
jgi:hypothetical protein